MRRASPRVVVLGMMGRTPFAGVIWQVLHYLEGLRRLGCFVWYVEDTGDWPYDPEQNAVTADCAYTVRYLGRLMEWCGLRDRWAYRSASDGQFYKRRRSDSSVHGGNCAARLYAGAVA